MGFCSSPGLLWRQRARPEVTGLDVWMSEVMCQVQECVNKESVVSLMAREPVL